MKRFSPSFGVLGLACWLAWPVPSTAQVFGTGVLPVTEVGATLFHSGVTATQSVITAGQMVLSVANQALELLPLENVVVVSSLAEDVALITAIMEDAAGLKQDVEAMIRLFDPHALPTTLPAMVARTRAMDEALYEAQCYAVKTQALIRSLISALGHLTGLVNGIEVLKGNMQGNQTLIQLNASMQKVLIVHTTQAASGARIEALRQMRHQVVVAMDAEITRQYWAPYFKID